MGLTSGILNKNNLIAYCKLARINRPTGVWLLLFPSWWSITLASSGLPNPKLMLLFALGAFLMRSAGCVYNDIVDKDFDSQVERTKHRPLANGILSQLQAYSFLATLLLLSLCILVQLSSLTIVLGIVSLILVFTYPWMKRITYWPQIFLGITFNCGALMGWSAVHNHLDYPAFYLYAAGIFWTLFYDTIYAHQDKMDDIFIGVKSSALKLGSWSKPFLLGCTIGIVGLLLLAGTNPIHHIATLAVATHLLWQVTSVDLENPQDCMVKFKSNQWIGWIVLLGMVINPRFF